jgi:type I restriction enzyme S subunit
VALADSSVNGFNTVRAVARIRCGPDLSRLYLAHFLSTAFAQAFFARETRTVSQPTLNIRQIEETNILLPPLPKQQKFASLMEKVESLRARQKESEKELGNLFNSLMQRAFKGELFTNG